MSSFCDLHMYLTASNCLHISTVKHAVNVVIPRKSCQLYTSPEQLCSCPSYFCLLFTRRHDVKYTVKDILMVIRVCHVSISWKQKAFYAFALLHLLYLTSWGDVWCNG